MEEEPEICGMRLGTKVLWLKHNEPGSPHLTRIQLMRAPTLSFCH